MSKKPNKIDVNDKGELVQSTDYHSNIRLDEWEGGNSIMDHLKYARIFSLKKLEDGNFRLQEECDQYFTVDLTPAALKNLISYLTELSSTTLHK